MRSLVGGALLLATLLPPRAPPRPSASLWGVALALHPREAARQGFAYPPDPTPLTGLGTRAILLTPSWEVADVHGSELRPGEVRDVTLRRVIRRARALGLSVALAPWVALERAGPHEWRGALDPSDRRRWWRSYARFVLHYARLAAEEGVAILAIGHELSSLGADPAWAGIARRVREVYAGPLTFIANHDALDAIPADAIDVLGVSAYFPLADDPDASEVRMRRRWRAAAERLRRLKERHGKPLVLFEVGYPSRDGGAVRPWDDASSAPADPEEQRRAYAALTATLRDAPWLDGVFFWTWFGEGGPHDRHYTVLGKPAEELVRAFLQRRRSVFTASW